MNAGERKLADIGVFWSKVSHTIFVVLVPFDAILERENERNYAASLRAGGPIIIIALRVRRAANPAKMHVVGG